MIHGFGEPSKKVIRSSFVMGGLNIGDVEELYSRWVKRDVFVNFYDKEKDLEWDMKSPKRGNDVYAQRLYARFMGYREKFMGFVGGMSKEFSRVVMVTLTLRRDVSLVDAWLNIGRYFNNFYTKVTNWCKRNYSRKPIQFRSWEVHRDGYPHIHCMMVLPFEFGVKRKRSKKGGVRVYVEETLRDKLKSFWTLGWIDVVGVINFSDAFNYIAKYCVKLAYNVDNFKMSILWVFGKRMWSVSRDVRLDRRKPNSNVVCLGLSDDVGVFCDFSKNLADDGRIGYEKTEWFRYVMGKHNIKQKVL